MDISKLTIHPLLELNNRRFPPMDPNAALKTLRSTTWVLNNLSEGDRADASLVDLVHEIRESVEALDGWLKGGGFLPEDWQANRPASFTDGPMYAVHATYSRQLDEHSTRNGQVPSFYLHPNVQGILDEDQAARVATDILTAGTAPDDAITYHVTAYRV